MLWEQKRLKSSWIPCRILHLSPLEAERLVIESNRQRVKTAGQKARESNELVRIFSADQDVRSAIARIARETKQGVRTVNKQIMIVTEAGARNVVAQNALAELDKNQTSVSAAYRAISPQKRTLRNSPLGGRVAALETLARKLPNDLKDPTNKEFLAEAVARIGAAVRLLHRS
jgi:hypothetical protein